MLISKIIFDLKLKSYSSLSSNEKLFLNSTKGLLDKVWIKEKRFPVTSINESECLSEEEWKKFKKNRFKYK